MRIIPPGSGIVHQVNLEYLARVVFDQDGYYYPDSLVGTDSHTTMIDGLGVLGWCKTWLGLCTLFLEPTQIIANSVKGILQPNYKMTAQFLNFQVGHLRLSPLTYK